jgi:NAD(P)-dependent dehydrogenase (short-subunit alcohol dehydrogenase family)
VTAASGRILVTGGLSGIGAAVVSEFGDRCVVWSRRGGVDTTDEDSVRAATADLLESGGPPFALVHCVGDFDEQTLLDADTAHYRHMVESNLTSAFLLSRHVVAAMRDNRRGRVIFFAAGGVENRTASTRAPIYFAVKAALVSMARSLAAEVAPQNLTVNVISPGIIRHETSHASSQDRMEPRVPLGRAGTTDDLIPLIRHLLSDAAAYTTGTNLTVDGGLSL